VDAPDVTEKCLQDYWQACWVDDRFELLDAQRTYNAALTAFNQARADGLHGGFGADWFAVFSLTLVPLLCQPW
jgi:hypothetical protein